ncbi:hypothetical protein AHAS_Ahas11G0124700 [Arachis hypogaea]
MSALGTMEVRVFSELVNKSRVVEECSKKDAVVENDRKEFDRREYNQSFAPRGQEFKKSGYRLRHSQG